ncbi:MAG TPA: CDP-alcohol phosphatidyltransferase family protein [Terriglobales bacterium]|nr:CDP-alcohol phosphatidyltransferase family protein [Terriglobales bacterium]
MVRNYQLADLITLLNAGSGTGAIFAMMSYLLSPDPWRVYLALCLIPLAFVLDVLDGRVARARHEHSIFGRELDSLADIVSFGTAPAAIAYGLGMRGALDVLVLIYFIACGISRLARYNITAARLSDEAGKVKYYEGTPIPSSLILVGVLALCFALDQFGSELPLGVIELAGMQWHPLSTLFFINGSTMISKTLHIPKL